MVTHKRMHARWQVISEPFQHTRPLLVGLLAILLITGIWFGLSELSVHARIAFITFGLAVLGWVLTDIDDTYIAITAAIVFAVTGIDEPDEFFETLGDSTIWLLLASFIVAAAVTASGISHRLTLAVATRARSITQLFYLLTGVILITALIIPSTSGRAALMVPVCAAFSAGIGDRRISRALALLFPTIILLSAIASLIGVGAHLVTVEILWRMGGEQISFGQWLMLGLPFAIVSCFVSAWVIQRMFLRADERRRPLRLTLDQLALSDNKLSAAGAGPFSRAEKYALFVVLALVLLWMTEPLHGINNTIVALLGALAVTMPNVGVLSFKEAVKKVEWNMLLFMAATLELGEALIESGGAEWIVQGLFRTLQGGATNSALFATAVVAIVSLLSHLLITSRTARASVLIPLVVLLGVSLGFNPTTLAFISTAAAGFCLTLTVSAKPMAMFSQLKQPTYQPKDLLRLSGVLLPVHFVLLLAFAFLVWPLMGLTLTHETPKTPPHAPDWYERSYHQDDSTDLFTSILSPSWIALDANSDGERSAIMFNPVTTDASTDTFAPALSPVGTAFETNSAGERSATTLDTTTTGAQQLEHAPLPVAPASAGEHEASASSAPAASQTLALADQSHRAGGGRNIDRP